MRFLRMVFGVGEDHRMFQEDVMRWKCFAPHPYWEGGRGYALRYKGEIAAFGCVVPCRFGTAASCNVIDWAASKTVPGAGVMLYRHIQSLAGTMINIGGTEDARGVLPRIGFAVRAELRHFTRVLRPWQQLRQGGAGDWKAPLRLARDYRELARNGDTHFTVRRVARFDDALLDFFQACPAAAIEGYELEDASGPVGRFLLSRIGDECRVADLWSDDLPGAYAAAVQTAGGATRIAAATSSPEKASALEQAGFRQTHTEPVFVNDPKGMLPEHPAVGLLENDGFYWHA